MALKGLDVFKFTPKTNCKECGCPTCMSFSMKVACGAVTIDKCPYMSKEALRTLAQMGGDLFLQKIDNRGHEFAEKHANHLADLYPEKDTRTLEDDNVKNEVDRIIDDVDNKSKYCTSDESCVQEYFDGEIKWMRFACQQSKVCPEWLKKLKIDASDPKCLAIQEGLMLSIAVSLAFLGKREGGFTEWPYKERLAEASLCNFFGISVFEEYEDIDEEDIPSIDTYEDLSNKYDIYIDNRILEEAFRIAQEDEIIYSLDANIKNNSFVLKKTGEKRRRTRKEDKSLIDKGYFGEKFDINMSRIFPVVVMATMSSGKSTLINALLGEDILPSKNEACTAKLFSVLDDDEAEELKLYVTKKDGQILVIDKNIPRELEKMNCDIQVEKILLSGQIRGVQNTDRSLLIIDTPGPNNSQDDSHKHITEEILNKVYGGLILYVINATQMGICDDMRFLQIVRERMSKKKELHILFVVNKMDQLDEERESIWEILWQIRKYLQTNGFVDPEIIPVSALAANLFKKVMRGTELTRMERRNFGFLYDLFDSKELCLGSYAFTNGLSDPHEIVVIDDEEYSLMQLENAIDNTGIPYLERRIQHYQILSSRRLGLQVKIKGKKHKEEI